MTLRELYQKEKDVVVHGQSKRFRILKYLVIVAIAALVYMWRGLATVGFLFLFLFVASIAIHFFFRWKTDAWEKSWGPYILKK